MSEKMKLQIGDKETQIINGIEYEFQHPGIPWYLDHIDNTSNQFGKKKKKKYYQGLFDAVITQPKGIKIRDFAGVSELMDLGEAIEKFLGAQV